MERRLKVARAGFVVACGLFAAALPDRTPVHVECREPRLRAAGEVVCGAVGGELDGPERRLFGLPVDPNHADALTLETLPGIGPARARAILAERTRRPFSSLADLERVHGLGPVRVAALAEFVDFDAVMAGTQASSVESGARRSAPGDTPEPGARASGIPEALREGP